MTLTNYRNGADGIQPRPIDKVHSQLPGCVTERLRRCKGLLCAVADEGYLEFLHDATMFFAWLNLHCSIDWETGYGMVSKDEFFLYVRHHSPVMKREEVPA